MVAWVDLNHRPRPYQASATTQVTVNGQSLIGAPTNPSRAPVTYLGFEGESSFTWLPERKSRWSFAACPLIALKVPTGYGNRSTSGRVASVSRQAIGRLELQ